MRTAGSCGVGHARRDRHHRVRRRPHPRRHITGGRLNHFSRHPARRSVWTGISWLNLRHMQLALITLGMLMLTGLYIMLVASGTSSDLRFFN